MLEVRTSPPIPARRQIVTWAADSVPRLVPTSHRGSPLRSRRCSMTASMSVTCSGLPRIPGSIPCHGTKCWYIFGGRVSRRRIRTSKPRATGNDRSWITLRQTGLRKLLREPMGVGRTRRGMTAERLASGLDRRWSTFRESMDDCAVPGMERSPFLVRAPVEGTCVRAVDVAGQAAARRTRGTAAMSRRV